jgi:hypothetical protein
LCRGVEGKPQPSPSVGPLFEKPTPSALRPCPCDPVAPPPPPRARTPGNVRMVRRTMRAFRHIGSPLVGYPEFLEGLGLPDDEGSWALFHQFLPAVRPTDRVSPLEVVGGLIVVCKGNAREKIKGAWCGACVCV